MLLLLALAVRVWRLDVDVPSTITPGYGGQAHWRDEPAKAHEARNFVLFGEWTHGAADEYDVWRRQSPVWVYTEVACFRLFGVGYVQARGLVIAEVLLALGVWFWLIWVRHGAVAASAATALLGLGFPFVVYTRLALMEGVLMAFLVGVAACFVAALRAGARANAWVVLAGAFWLLALFTKQTALGFWPLLPLGVWLSVRGATPSNRPAVARTGVIVCATTLVVVAFAFLDADYVERFRFNAAHYAGEASVAEQARATMFRAPSMLWNLATRLAPISSACTVCLVGYALWRRSRTAKGRDQDPLVIYLVAWLLLCLVTSALTRHDALRFHLPALVPLSGLAGVFVGRVWETVGKRSPSLQIVLLLALTSAFIVVDGRPYLRWMATAPSTLARSGSALEAIVGDRDATIAGEYAAQVAFETPYRHVYLRPTQFNRTREVILALGATHVVFAEDDFVERLMKRQTPERLQGKRLIGEIEFRGRRLSVYELRPTE